MSDDEYEPSDEELWSYSKKLYAGMPLGYIQKAVQIYRKDRERGFPLMKELMAREEERLKGVPPLKTLSSVDLGENEELATLPLKGVPPLKTLSSGDMGGLFTPQLDSCDAFDTEIPAQDLKNYLEEKEKQEE